MEIKKYKQIKIIGPTEEIEEIIGKIQSEELAKNKWFVISSNKSTVDETKQIVTLIKIKE